MSEQPITQSAQAMDPWGNVIEPPSPEQNNSVPDVMIEEAAESSVSWMDSLVDAEPIRNSLAEPFATPWFDVRALINEFVAFLVLHTRGFFDVTKQPVEWVLDFFAWVLGSGLHPAMIIVVFALICWQMSGWRLAIGALVGLIFVGAMSVWDEAMITLALVLSSLFFCLLLGVPIGILMSKSDRAASALRPVLDAMQTTPAFVYLVPVVMLFGIGRVPGVIVTIIFSVPPLIRLTNLGIRQVSSDLVEASRSFGANGRQILVRVQLPLAMPTIMAGVNQALMLSLSMVVIASMIAVPGLGLMVLRGIGRLDVGLATVGGLAIVILAILLDRMTQSLGREARERGTRHWYQSGPIGWSLSVLQSLSVKQESNK